MISSNTTFWGYRRENGRVGVRNHVIILPVDDLSNAACEAVANNIKGTIALPHAYGRLQFGEDLESHFRTMIGTGALAPHLIRVHSKIRPIRQVTIWGRRTEQAEALALELSATLPGQLGRPIEVRAASERKAAVMEADIVSCATLSQTPLIEGAWLHEGQHIDLVGAYTPRMRESDDDAISRARIFVDTRGGALKEGGDIVQPLVRNIISATDVIADLFELARGECPGRAANEVGTITLFKSVGAALEDLAAAELAVECALPSSLA